MRHNLSLNKCFAKVETPKTAAQQASTNRKVCLWGMNPAKIEKMEDEISKWRKKDLNAIKRAMVNPGECSIFLVILKRLRQFRHNIKNIYFFIWFYGSIFITL